jgi:hypothetical protein
MSTEMTVEPSMYEHKGAPEWPLNALPKHWMEALFAKMIAFYGSKFALMWQGSNSVEVQKVWAVELFKLSREQLKAGSDSLSALPKPPTLPEFIALCKSARLEQAAFQAPRLEAVTPADQKVIDSNLAKLRSIAGSMRMKSAHPGWAYDFFIRGAAKNGQPTTVEVEKNCRETILSSPGRAYPASQEGERAQKCAEILGRLVRESMEAQ